MRFDMPEMDIRLRPLRPEEGGGWLAEIPEMPGCMSDGETPEEAIANLRDAAHFWLEAQGSRGPVRASALPERKQVILVRRDLGMRRGKEIAQGAHASLMAALNNLDHPHTKAWMAGQYAKVVLSVDGEDELKRLHHEAREAGLISSLITDAGRTEFGGVPTLTTAAIGPAFGADIDPLTGHLKLR